MKIGIICNPTIGGSGAIATELGIWLAQKGHEIHFITYEIPFRLREKYTKNIYYHTVTLQHYDLFKYPPYTMALAVKISEIVKWHQLDLLHVHYAIPHAISAFLAREMLGGLKFVTTLHGTDVTLIGQDPSFKDLTAMALSKSDAVTAVSNSLKSDCQNIFQLEQDINVIHNFVDLSRFHPNIRCNHFHPEAKGQEKIIIHVSNFRHLKRVDDTIRVFNLIQKKIPARLFLVGDGEGMCQVRQLCKEFEICDKVEFLGEQESIACILPRCDLFLLTSELESFGLAALEGMACGLPVVATRAGGLNEVIEHGKNGFLSEIGNVEEMAQNALHILDEKLHLNFSQSAQKRAQNHFDIEHIGPKYEQLYMNTIKS